MAYVRYSLPCKILFKTPHRASLASDCVSSLWSSEQGRPPRAAGDRPSVTCEPGWQGPLLKAELPRECLVLLSPGFQLGSAQKWI